MSGQRGMHERERGSPDICRSRVGKVSADSQ